VWVEGSLAPRPRPRTCAYRSLSMLTSMALPRHRHRTGPSNATACAGDRYALLFRGQSQHWGCSAASAFLQRLCVRSHHAMISEPLERQGHCVSVFLALNPAVTGGCTEHAVDVADNELHGGRVHTIKNVKPSSKTQSSNFRMAFNVFLQHGYQSNDALGSGLGYYDYLIITRYDLRLLRPIDHWQCRSSAEERSKLGLASRCGASSFATWQCTFDTLFIVPHAHIPAFDRSVGSTDKPGSRSARCCFNEICMAGGVSSTGQACYNVFARRLAGNASNISFCFPPPSHGGLRTPNGPDYQCCSRGLTNWSRVYEAERSRDLTATLGAHSPSNISWGLHTMGDKYRAWTRGWEAHR